MITEIDALQEENEGKWDYWKIYSSCEVTFDYSCRPYFYVYAKPSSTKHLDNMEKVLYASIDRTYKDVTKEFNGVLF